MRIGQLYSTRALQNLKQVIKPYKYDALGSDGLQKFKKLSPNGLIYGSDFNKLIVESASIAMADARVSLVEGASFVWLVGVDLSTYQDGNHRIVLHDTNNNSIWGYILKSNPAGETLGSELGVNADFESGFTAGLADGFGIGDGPATTHAVSDETSIVHGGSHSQEFHRASGSSYIFIRETLAGLTQNALFKQIQWFYVSAQTTLLFKVQESGGDYTVYTNGGAGESKVIPATTWTSKTYYFNKPDASNTYAFLLQISNSNNNIYMDDCSLKQVTDPPSTGAHIISTKDGSVRNWSVIDLGFDPNKINSYEIQRVW